MLKIYNAAKGSWDSSDNILPYTVNHKQDESLDSAVVMRITNTKDSLPVLQKVKLIDGINESHWIVRVSPTQRIGYKKYLQTIELDEPLEMTKGLPIGTLTFSQPLVTDQYHQRFRLDEVIDRMLSITPTIKRNDLIPTLDSKFKLDDNIRTLFHSIDSPEFYWNEYSLYEALVEIGSYLDMFPKITFDGYNTTGLMTITFVPLDIVNKTNYGISGLVTEETQQPLDNYANKVISNVNNMAVDTTVIYPGKGLGVYVNAPYDVSSITDENAIITLPYPIKKIVKFEILKNIIDAVWEDFTDYNIEYNLWQLKGTGQFRYVYWKYNDSNLYNIKSFIDQFPGGGDTPKPTVRGTIFRITFVPLMDARVMKENAGAVDYTVVYNQNNNIVESSVFAKHLQSYVKRMENGDYIVSKIYKSLSDMPQLGHNVNGYVLTNLSYEKYRNYYDVTMQLSKNYTRRAMFIRAKSEPRTWEIAADNKVLTRSLVYTDKMYLSINEELVLYDSNIVDIRRLFPALVSPLNEPLPLTNGQLAVLNFYLRDGNIIPLVMIPVISRFGNSILFNFKMFDNTIAGYSKAVGWDGSTVSQQVAVSYTDGYGNFEYVDIGFTDVYSDIIGTEAMARNYPSSDWITNDALMARAYLKIQELIGKKDSREIFSLTYQLDALPKNSNFVVHDNLIKYALNYNYNYKTYILFSLKPIQSTDTINLADITSKIRVAVCTLVSANCIEYTFDKTLLSGFFFTIAIAFDNEYITNQPLLIQNNLTQAQIDNLFITGKLKVYFR